MRWLVVPWDRSGAVRRPCRRARPRSLPTGRTRGTRTPSRPGLAAEDGFSVLEATVAFTVLLVALAGLGATLGLGVRAGGESRARAGAVDLAVAELERAQAGPLAGVGLAVGDATLAADPDVAGGAVAATGEALVTVPSPLWPVHAWTATAGGATIGLRVLVSDPPDAVCTACRRVAVVASWTSTTGATADVRVEALVGATAVQVVLP